MKFTLTVAGEFLKQALYLIMMIVSYSIVQNSYGLSYWILPMIMLLIAICTANRKLKMKQQQVTSSHRYSTVNDGTLTGRNHQVAGSGLTMHNQMHNDAMVLHEQAHTNAMNMHEQAHTNAMSMQEQQIQMDMNNQFMDESMKSVTAFDMGGYLTGPDVNPSDGMSCDQFDMDFGGMNDFGNMF